MRSLLDGKTKWHYNPVFSLDDEGYEAVWRDSGLSLKAKGLFGYMRSKPNGWDFCASRIADECKDARKSVLAGMKELEERGFLNKRKLGSGRMKYKLSDEPWIGIEPQIVRSPLEGLEIIIEDEFPVAQGYNSKQDYLRDAYKAYDIDDEGVTIIVSMADGMSNSEFNQWMQDNRGLVESELGINCVEVGF